eukprot:CAMPEP_0176018854 /NCGR_PEP_ID=MMETSP0120_2-20121206/9090_1 /TAXON_ID=160619 /ORGANISM="Kryptoperidinium foliaceum, Strain CCMP 1326" /LENGTH=363 /DNA_ID=CAMNT_0017351913 /DNA_START=168 /DNA_END=1259 /DNA_ORIENTATION=-
MTGGAATPSSPTESQISRSQEDFLKWGAVVALTTISLFFSLAFRYARKQEGPGFSNMTGVVSSEIIKMACSAVAIFWSSGRDQLRCSLTRVLYSEFRATLMMGIPGGIYLVQNYLFFVGLSHLSATLYQVSKQLAIVTTAIVWTLWLQKRISAEKWWSILAVLVGVCIVSFKGDVGVQGNFTIGVSAIVMACFLSSIATVYTETQIKIESFTIWERNIQLSLFGLVMGLGELVMAERDDVMNNGFFYGYNSAVWCIVMLQSVGGLTTAVVLKYADSVTKCVSKAVAVVLGVVCSRIFFAEGPPMYSMHLWLGLFVTLGGVAVYSLGFEVVCCPVQQLLASPPKADDGEVDPETVGLAEVIEDQ